MKVWQCPREINILEKTKSICDHSHRSMFFSCEMGVFKWPPYDRFSCREISLMSQGVLSWICVLLVVFVPVVHGSIIDLKGGVNGGVDCASCSIVLGIVDHLMIVYNESAAQSLERLCVYLPDPYQGYCKTALAFLGKSTAPLSHI